MLFVLFIKPVTLAIRDSGGKGGIIGKFMFADDILLLISSSTSSIAKITLST